MRRFHILVTPAPDEASRVTVEQVHAAVAWLRATTESFEPFPQTGGYMIVAAESLPALDNLLATYPLRETVTLDINELVTVEAGFGVLLAALDRYAGAAT